MSERLVQYEFKVIVQTDADAWPNEVRAEVESALKAEASLPVRKIVSVERVRDGY